MVPSKNHAVELFLCGMTLLHDSQSCGFTYKKGSIQFDVM